MGAGTTLVTPRSTLGPPAVLTAVSLAHLSLTYATRPLHLVERSSSFDCSSISVLSGSEFTSVPGMNRYAVDGALTVAIASLYRIDLIHIRRKSMQIRFCSDKLTGNI